MPSKRIRHRHHGRNPGTVTSRVISLARGRRGAAVGALLIGSIDGGALTGGRALIATAVRILAIVITAAFASGLIALAILLMRAVLRVNGQGFERCVYLLKLLLFYGPCFLRSQIPGEAATGVRESPPTVGSLPIVASTARDPGEIAILTMTGWRAPPHIYDRYPQPGIHPEALDAAECLLGVKFPAELRSLYLISDGVYETTSGLWIAWPLCVLLHENTRRRQAGALPADLIAFGDDSNGEALCIEPGHQDIICWHPVGRRKQAVAPDLMTFWSGRTDPPGHKALPCDAGSLLVRKLESVQNRARSEPILGVMQSRLAPQVLGPTDRVPRRRREPVQPVNFSGSVMRVDQHDKGIGEHAYNRERDRDDGGRPFPCRTQRVQDFRPRESARNVRPCPSYGRSQ